MAPKVAATSVVSVSPRVYAPGEAIASLAAFGSNTMAAALAEEARRRDRAIKSGA